MVTVESYPVLSLGQNVFPGNSPVEIGFKREDIVVVDTEQGIDNTVIINLGSDITGSLNVGEYVYLSSEIYETSSEVLETNAAYIRIDTQWLGAGSTGGYLNYKQNWNIELDLVNPLNDAIKVLPFTLRDNGDNAGNVLIDLSIVNDLANIQVPTFVAIAELTNQRTKFDIKWREIWRESLATVYTRITDPIIIITAKDQPTIEAFNNDFTEPEYYVGYKNGAVFIHSDVAPGFLTNVNFYYDELDINKAVIRANQLIGSVTSANVWGKIFVPLFDLPLLSDTYYIDLKTETALLPEFSATDFTNDFNIT